MASERQVIDKPFAPSCTQCGNACETSHYDPIALKCPRGHRFEGSWPTHGESRSTVLSWRSLLRGDWRAVWLARGEGGPMVVDACPKCERPVTLDADTELSYRLYTLWKALDDCRGPGRSRPSAGIDTAKADVELFQQRSDPTGVGLHVDVEPDALARPVSPQTSQ
jgi:hypothetical protein